MRDRILQLARGELGVAESGGEDRGGRINEYRRSVVGRLGDKPAPWCAYFVSWLFNKAGRPIVDGNGDGLVANVGDWAKKHGRFSGRGSTPTPGDVILFKNPGGSAHWTNHIGVVERVGADGTITTIEGNASDAVRRRTYRPSDGRIVGFVSAT